MKGRTFRIEIGECCGYRCAQLIQVVDQRHDHLLQWTSSDDTTNRKWKKNHDPAKDDHLDWEMKLSAVKEALRRAVEEGNMTQEEADAELAKWLEANPDPGVPIDVTEIFGIPVRIIKREEVEVER